MSESVMVSGYNTEMVRDGTAYYYGYSDFYNYGYWEAGVQSQKEACENLMEKLLQFMPNKQGTILDVACGLGATTRHLLKYYDAAAVTGINISRAQLARARQNAPGATFQVMDAVQLDFPDASFDNIICVEAAFHFNTRDSFLHEAYRVLKPGGRLVMSDILFRRLRERTAERASLPNANLLENPAAHREGLLAAGFRQAEVVDASQACWGGFRENTRRWPRQERKAGRLRGRMFWRAVIRLWIARNILSRGVRYYVLAWAEK